MEEEGNGRDSDSHRVLILNFNNKIIKMSSQHKPRSLYLKEGELLSHGCGLDLIRPTRTRHRCHCGNVLQSVRQSAARSQERTWHNDTTNLLYHLTKNHDKEYRESQRGKAGKAGSSQVNVVKRKKPQTQTLQATGFTRGTQMEGDNYSLSALEAYHNKAHL